MAVDRERIGVMAMEAMDDLHPGDDAALQAVGILVAVSHGAQSTVSYRFKDQDGNDVDLSIGLQMLGMMIQAIGRGGGGTPG